MIYLMIYLGKDVRTLLCYTILKELRYTMKNNLNTKHIKSILILRSSKTQSYYTHGLNLVKGKMQ